MGVSIKETPFVLLLGFIIVFLTGCSIPDPLNGADEVYLRKLQSFSSLYAACGVDGAD